MNRQSGFFFFATVDTFPQISKQKAVAKFKPKMKGIL